MVVTVNDYLARETPSGWEKIYHFSGLFGRGDPARSLFFSTIQDTARPIRDLFFLSPAPGEKHIMRYYLRDQQRIRLWLSPGQHEIWSLWLQPERELNYAIVDEVEQHPYRRSADSSDHIRTFRGVELTSYLQDKQDNPKPQNSTLTLRSMKNLSTVTLNESGNAKSRAFARCVQSVRPVEHRTGAPRDCRLW